MALANYVKFRRGTPAQYAAILTKDADCLYFISETNASEGLLYLGNKLISGSLSSNTSLSDLQDILLGENISTNSILVYDGTQQKWVNKPFSEVFGDITGSLIEMTGATENNDGASGTVPQPLAGDQNKFLRGDGSWATISEFTAVHAQTLNTLNTKVGTLIGDDEDLSMRAVAAQEVAKIVANAPAAFDTLKEIADWIENQPSDVTEINNRIGVLETKVGTLETNVSSLTDGLSAVNTTILALQDADDVLQSQIDDLDQRLKWINMSDEESNG